MKALLINPHKLLPRSLSVTQRSSPPLGLAYIASVLHSCEVQVEVIDCIAECPDNYFTHKGYTEFVAQGIGFADFFEKLHAHYELIGITCMFSNNWLINRELINELKKRYPNSLIIAGGEHVSAIPEFCLEDCSGLDMVVCGEGEETITEIVHCLKSEQPLHQITGTVTKTTNGKEILNNGKRERIRKPEVIPYPLWNVFPLSKYYDNDLSYGLALGNSLPISATRGCPYECTFCSSPQMWTTKYTMRPVADVIAEIKHLNSTFNATNIDFYDLTALVNRRWVLDFCEALKKESLIITWQIPAGTRSEVIDYQVAVALKETGCANITYAPETGSERMLEYVKKRVKIDRMLRSISDSHRAGLNIKLNIIMGYPEEKASDLMATIRFLLKASFYGARDASPSIFSPYPGSALFNQLKQEGKIELNDEYFARIVSSESFHDFVSYNKHVTKWMLIAMQYLGYLSFYISNFIFRPIRAFSFLSNIFSGKYETRGEYMVTMLIERFLKINLGASVKAK